MSFHWRCAVPSRIRPVLQRLLSRFQPLSRGVWVESSWQTPHADGLAQLFHGGQVGGKRLPVREFSGAVTAFRVEIIKQAGSAALVGIFGNVSRLFGLVQVARTVEGDHEVI